MVIIAELSLFLQRQLGKFMKKSTIITALAVSWAALFAVGVQAQVTIDIDTQQRGAKVSPMLYGIFYEDIQTYHASFCHAAGCWFGQRNG